MSENVQSMQQDNIMVRQSADEQIYQQAQHDYMEEDDEMNEHIESLDNQRELHKSQGSRDLNTLGMRDENSQFQSN
jgi:hypothetical protein